MHINLPLRIQVVNNDLENSIKLNDVYRNLFYTKLHRKSNFIKGKLLNFNKKLSDF
jgi:hypothetical protein